MVITRLSGGMGNQMFQYAIGRALSLKQNVPLGLDLAFLLDRTPRPNFTFRNFDLDVFNIKASIVPQNKIPILHRLHGNLKIVVYLDYIRRKLFKIRGTEKSFNYDNNILSLKGNVYLEGFWQSYKYFNDIKDVLKTDFTLKDPLSENVQTLFKEIKNQNSLCIHVRRADYVGNKYHDVVDINYYNEGLQQILKNTKVDKIYVFSDDIAWCEENLHFPLPVQYVGQEYAGKKAEGHLVLMSACKSFIIANSSFSWWAAWLAQDDGKVVVAPKQWFVDGYRDTTDLIPPEWIRI